MACKNFSQFACLLVVALAVNWANGDLPEKLLGAVDTTIQRYPFVVSLRDLGDHFCGGAILNTTHIVTAGHCVDTLIDDEAEMRRLTIWSGTDNLLKGGVKHTAVRASLHPAYFRDEDNVAYDIGLIELSKPIIFNNVQKAVTLPTRDYTMSEPNAAVTIVAWGDTSFPNGKTSANLQKLTVRMLKRAVCGQYYQEKISQDFFCTYQTRNVGTCSGDSGSPIMYKNQLIGVVSHGIPCAIGIPDMQTNVHYVLNYLRGNNV